MVRRWISYKGSCFGGLGLTLVLFTKEVTVTNRWRLEEFHTTKDSCNLTTLLPEARLYISTNTSNLLTDAHFIVRESQHQPRLNQANPTPHPSIPTI